MISRRSLLAAAVLAAAFVPLALAQAPGGTSADWMLMAQAYLGDEGLQKELGLSADQIRKANELASTGMERMRDRLGADEKKRQQIEAAARKDLEGLLKAAQLTRLRQVMLQHTANNRFGAGILANDAELVKQLKLSAEQVKKLRARGKLDDVLTQEQQKEWKKLTGKPYTEPLRLAGGFPRPRVPAPVTLQYLAATAVRDELKLTEKQQEKVADLTQKYEKALGQADAKKADELEAEAIKEARALLKEAQLGRLDQIELQLNTRPGRENAVLTHPRVVEGLKLTKEQQDRIRATFEKRRKEMLGLFAADDEPKRIVESVGSFKKETARQLETALDAKQRAALKGLVGEPFAGEVRLRTRTPSGWGTSSRSSGTLYIYAEGAPYVGSSTLHKELKIGAATAKKLTAFAEKAYSSTGRGRFEGKSQQEVADANRKELATLLDPNQMKRFEEIWLQRVSKSGLRGSAPHRFAEVQETLKLTEAQMAKLNRREELTTVLDAAQSKRWKEMLGERFTGRLSLPAGGFARLNRPQSVLFAAVKSPAVATELKLTAAQQKKIDEAEKAWQAEDANIRRNSAFGEGAKQRQAALQTLDLAVGKTLDEKQNARLQQLFLQDANRSGLMAVLLRKEVRSALKLDEKQQEKIEAIRAGQDQVQTLLFAEYGSRGDDAEGYRKARESITKDTTKRLEAALTAKQKKQLDALLGEPFTGEIDRPRFGGFGG